MDDPTKEEQDNKIPEFTRWDYQAFSINGDLVNGLNLPELGGAGWECVVVTTTGPNTFKVLCKRPRMLIVAGSLDQVGLRVM